LNPKRVGRKVLFLEKAGSMLQGGETCMPGGHKWGPPKKGKKQDPPMHVSPLAFYTFVTRRAPDIKKKRKRKRCTVMLLCRLKMLDNKVC
jgi:hypothetical protein